LPALLAQVRGEVLTAPPVEALQPLTGEGTLVAVQFDHRQWADALQNLLEAPVRRWQTSDYLGVQAVDHASFEEHGAALRAHCEGVRVVVADGGSARALQAAGVEVTWLHELVHRDVEGLGSCVCGGEETPLACCGGGGPLATHHPDAARRLAERWLRDASSSELRDGRCAGHLRARGGVVHDTVDRLLERSS